MTWDGCIVLDSAGNVKRRAPLPGPGLRSYHAGSGLLVVPGLIDLHVHLRGLRLSYKEDERSGTMAALSAGITLVVDMPNTDPPITSLEALEAKLGALRRLAVTDYSLYVGVSSRVEELLAMLSRPVAGVKVYPRDIAARLHVVSHIPQSTLIMLHPELPKAERLHADSESSRSVIRGQHFETAAVYMVCGVLRGRRIHVTHATTPSTIKAAKRLGATVDTTVNYITPLTSQECLLKVNPPRRSCWWEMLLSVLGGEVDCISSDHAPHTPREKSEDYLLCPPGIAGLEHWPWILFRLVGAGALSIHDYISLTSVNPAKVLGLYPRYGCLTPGSRGNVAIIDPHYRWRASSNEYSKARHTPYWMLEKLGRPKAVFIGGCLAFEEGSLSERSGFNPVNPFRGRGEE